MMWIDELAVGADGVRVRVVGPVNATVTPVDETAARVMGTDPVKLLSGPPDSDTETVTSAPVVVVVLTVVGLAAMLKLPSEFPPS